MNAIVAWAVKVKNTLHNYQGYSPHQLVLQMLCMQYTKSLLSQKPVKN